MRVDRFTVLFLAFLLSALVAVVLGSTPVAVTSAAVPTEPCLADAGAESPTIDADSLAVVDATTRTGRILSDAGASHSLVSPALSCAQCPPCGARSDRSPPA
jgi:D-alanyl-D-alanine carboxypeptidase